MNGYSAARTSFRTFGRIARPNAPRTFMSLASTKVSLSRNESHGNSQRKYTATAVAQGAGRNGTVSSNGKTLKLATPKELGGAGDGENPEQLFAMGYSGTCEPHWHSLLINLTATRSVSPWCYPARCAPDWQDRHGEECQGPR